MLEELLQALAEAGADAGPEELADILWLASRVDALRRHTTADALAGPAESTSAGEEPWHTGSSTSSGAPLFSAGRPTEPARPTDQLGDRVRVRRAPSLPDPLAIMRALRPVGRRTSAGSLTELDEERTVDHSIDQRT